MTSQSPPARSTQPKVVVVGGGVIGISCAYFLSRAGALVTVLERGAVAGEASYGNAGTISPGHPPLNEPGRVREAIRRVFDPSSPLYVPPRWDPELWRWLATFARHATHGHVREAMAVLAPLGHRALELFDNIIAEEALDCGFRQEGYFDVCASELGLTGARAEAEFIRPYGYTPGLIDADELRRIEPALAGSVTGAVHYPQAATLDPFRFVRGLAAACIRRGVTIREGVEVADIELVSGCVTGVRLAGGVIEAADAVVLATGPFSLRLARRAGVRLPVQPGKGYHRDIAIGPNGAPPLRIACVLHESSVFCTPLGDRVRFAGTMEFSGVNRVLRPTRLEQLTRAAQAAFPGLGDAAPLSEWCGLRPVSADGLPIIGSFGTARGVWVATGHGMLGLTLGPVTGELIADALVHDNPSPHLLALSPDRFHGKG